MNSLLWFFGIHSYHALQPLFQVLEQAVGWNAIELLTDQVAQYPLNAGLLDNASQLSRRPTDAVNRECVQHVPFFA